MNRLRYFLLSLAVALVTSCSPMRYSQYLGEETTWPTSGGSMADTSYAIPVYREWPERPYDVIGSVRFADPRAYWDDGIIRMAAKTGEKNGGDALVVRFGNASPGSWLDSWTSRPTGYGQEITALVVKWLPESVVKARQQEVQNFWAQFRKNHPAVSGNNQLLELATAYLSAEGVAPHSPVMEERLADLLSRIVGKPQTDLAGAWLFKGTVQSKRMTSTESETFFGVANATLNGNRLIIVSSEGQVELSFNGTVETGQLKGILGFGGQASSLSVECEGVALPEKISLPFRALVESGTVQGNLTFQR